MVFQAPLNVLVSSLTSTQTLRNSATRDGTGKPTRNTLKRSKGEVTQTKSDNASPTYVFLRFVEPPKSFQERYQMDFAAWNVGKEGPLTLTYPATIGEGQLSARQVSYDRIWRCEVGSWLLEALLNTGIPLAPLQVSERDMIGLGCFLHVLHFSLMAM